VSLLWVGFSGDGFVVRSLSDDHLSEELDIVKMLNEILIALEFLRIQLNSEFAWRFFEIGTSRCLEEEGGRIEIYSWSLAKLRHQMGGNVLPEIFVI
jgi:hypothetical protein